MKWPIRLPRTSRLREALTLLRRARHSAAPGADLPPAFKNPLPNLWQTHLKPAGPQPDPRFQTRSYTNTAGTRAYRLYIPTSCKTPHPALIVMLHGCTQSADDFAAGTGMNQLAETHGFLVAYPIQSPAANVSKCWNWFNAADQNRDAGEPSLIAGITREIIRAFAVDPAQVFVAGLSAGGAAAAIMGVAYPDLYAAIGVHSGLACGAATDMTSALSAMRQGATSIRAGTAPVRTIVFHGDRDTTVNAVNADQIIAQAKASAKLTATVAKGTSPGGVPFTRILNTDASGQVLLEQWILHGAGHAWSGGSPAGSYTNPAGPNASQEMLRFFLS